MVLLDSSSKGKSRRRLFYGGADSVLMRSSSFGMIFDDEVVGNILSETVIGFDRLVGDYCRPPLRSNGGNLTCILDYHDNLKCQFNSFGLRVIQVRRKRPQDRV